MTATTSTQPATLTPARKRLIRMALRNHGALATNWLSHLPSFAGVRISLISEWCDQLVPPPNAVPRNHPYSCATPTVTQATVAPAAPDTGTTGEWYSVLGIADGLGIGRERVYGWMQFGWLTGPRAPLFTAEDIRAFVRAHPLEIVPRYLTSEQWLWLVSVLAGSREGAA